MSFTLNNATTDYSAQLELYRQTGDICAFLNFDPMIFPLIPILARKLAALEAAGLHLTNNSILEVLVPSVLLRQFAVSQCAYEYQLAILDNQGEGGPLISNIVLPASMAILAVFFNISMLVVTAKKISMSTVCNWLLAFDSLCQLFAVLPFIENTFAVSANFLSVDYRLCLVTQMLSIASSYAGFLAVYFMSLERLLIVMMPIRMSQLSDKTIGRCSLLAILACTCFGVAINLIIFSTLRIDSTIYFSSRFLSCTHEILTLAVNGEDYVSITILALAMLNYVLIAGLIAWRRIYVPSTQTDSINDASHRQATYRMLRSVFIISLVVMFGYLFGYVLRRPIIFFITGLAPKIAQILNPNDWLTPAGFSFTISLSDWLMGLITCVFPLAAGLNAPVLIINNSDYREAYKKTFAPLRILCRKRTSGVAPVGPLFTTQIHNH